MMDCAVGDGAIIVATDQHVTLLIPPFSELNIYAWKTDSKIILFDEVQVFRNYLRDNSIAPEYDVLRLSQFLVSDRINNKLTAYSGLHEVEHAHSITAFRHHHEPVLEYNHLPALFAKTSGEPRSAAEAAEQIKALTAEAVRAKAAGNRIGLSTSGGIDSSLLATLYESEFPGKRPFLYHVFSSCILGFNEIDYFNDVRSRLSHHVRWLDTETTRDRQLKMPHMAAAFRPPVVSGWFERNWMLYEAARSDDVETLLSGDGGDQLMLCLDEMCLAREFVREGVPLIQSLIDEAFLDRASLWDVAVSWISGRADRAMRQWVHYDLDNTEKVAHLVSHTSHFPVKTFTDAEKYRGFKLSQQFQICTLNDAHYNSVASSLGVRERKPFLYWPLVRYCVACPRHILLSGGVKRGLFRRAFSHVLPRSISNRAGKSGDVDVPQLFDYKEIKTRIMESGQITDLLDLDAIAMIETDTLSDEVAEFLMRCATLDAYLRSLAR